MFSFGIPMLYPDSSFNRTIDESDDSRTMPSSSSKARRSLTLSPGDKLNSIRVVD